MKAITRSEAIVAIEGDGVDFRREVIDGGMSAAFVTLPAGAGLLPAAAGLPHDLCPCPLWGYMLSGRPRMHTTNGPQDHEAGQAFTGRRATRRRR